MTSCTACGLPAAPSYSTCPFCETPLPAPVPERIRIRVTGRAIELTEPGGVFAVAARSGLHWLLSRNDGSPMARLAPLATAAGTSFAVIATDARLLGTILHPRSGEPAAVIAGPAGSTQAALYTDGPTGLHLVGRDGTILGLLSRADPIEGGAFLDVLLTSAGREVPVELRDLQDPPFGIGAAPAQRHGRHRFRHTHGGAEDPGDSNPSCSWHRNEPPPDAPPRTPPVRQP